MPDHLVGQSDIVQSRDYQEAGRRRVMFGTQIVKRVQADRWRQPDLTDMLSHAVRPVVLVNASGAVDGLGRQFVMLIIGSDC